MFYLLDYEIGKRAYIFDTDDNTLQCVDWDVFEQGIDEQVQIKGVEDNGKSKILSRTAPYRQTRTVKDTDRGLFRISKLMFTDKGIRAEGSLFLYSKHKTDERAVEVWNSVLDSSNFIVPNKYGLAEPNSLISRVGSIERRVAFETKNFMSLFRIKGVQTVASAIGLSVCKRGSAFWNLSISGTNAFKPIIPNVYSVNFSSECCNSIRVSDVWRLLYVAGR